ncbi:MAG: hypothetical protein ACR2HZ_12400 [Gemmatimonadaceae bacterium]
MSAVAERPRGGERLVRAVGLWGLIAFCINAVVGSGIYLLPSESYELLGPFSLWVPLLFALPVFVLVLNFAEAASHFTQAAVLPVREDCVRRFRRLRDRLDERTGACFVRHNPFPASVEVPAAGAKWNEAALLMLFAYADGSIDRLELPVQPWLAGARRQTVRVRACPAITRIEIDPENAFPDVDRDNNRSPPERSGRTHPGRVEERRAPRAQSMDVSIPNPLRP